MGGLSESGAGVPVHTKSDPKRPPVDDVGQTEKRADPVSLRLAGAILRLRLSLSQIEFLLGDRLGLVVIEHRRDL